MFDYEYLNTDYEIKYPWEGCSVILSYGIEVQRTTSFIISCDGSNKIEIWEY